VASPFDSAQSPPITTEGAGDAFLALINQDHVAVAQNSADGRFVRVNRRLTEILGYSEAELLLLSDRDVTHPESLQATLENAARILTGSSHFVLQKKYVRKDGSVFSASTTVSAIRDNSGKLTGLVELIDDLSSQLRTQRLVEGQNAALQLIISGTPLKEVFSRLIAVVEAESAGDAFCSILLLDSATGQLRHGAAPSLPDAYNHTVHGIGIDPEVGTCAAAAATHKTVFTEDIATSPGWQALKHLPLALGLRAAWSMPIVSAEGEVLGTFGTYFRRSRLPSEAEIATVGMLTKTAAVAIERRQSEEHLRAAIGETNRQQRLYETVLSNTPDLVYVFNLEHRFTYANNALLSMWGRTWDDAIGKNCLELGYEPWHAEMHDREIEQVIATKKSIRGDVAFNGTNGRRFYDYIFAPVLGSSGEVEAIAGTTRDVTEPRKAATTIRFLSDLAQSLSTLTDEREIIRLTVSAVGRHLGAHRCYFVECLEKDNLIKLSENWVRDDAANLEGELSLYDFGGVDWWREYSKGDFAVEDTETNPLTKLKAANYAAANVRSYAVQPHKRTGQWTIVLAVTERHPRKWTEEELQLLENVAARVWPLVERARGAIALRAARDDALAASRAKDDFLAVLSHELRTPLNPVLLLASEAAGNAALPDAVRTDFETIVRNITLEARLIDDLLDLTRITHNKLPMAITLCDVSSLLHSVIGTMKQELEDKALVLTTRWDASTALVMGDDVRLQQVFWNLLKNAVKFTSPRGQLAIATRIPTDKPGVLEIEFTDTGLGLTAGEITKVFEPFAQGEHSAIDGRHHYGGLGLGLAISRKIVEMHAGTISAWSPGRNKGATFLVELPLAPTGSQFTTPGKASSKQLTQVPFSVSRRILLIEDHAPSRIALARLLAVRKIEVTQASSGADALEKAKNNSFDLVISDIGLPDMNGYDLMKILRDRHGCHGIALSGYGMEEDIARSRQAGFKAHLTKPVQIQNLDKMLEQFFRQ
jgi:PAS domain S-box-containing protein